jgi:hypothetical protein
MSTTTEPTVQHPAWCDEDLALPFGVLHRRKWLVDRAWFNGRWDELNVELTQYEGGGPACSRARVSYNLGDGDADECRKVAAILLEAADVLDGATA